MSEIKALSIAYLNEPAMQLVIAIVFFTGIVRGFSGFGSGMLIGPTTAALFTPKIALAMITIIDSVATLTMVWKAQRHVVWKEVFPVVIGYAVAVPLGVWFLKVADPATIRWFISISILIAIAALWSGWKYRGPRTNGVSFSVGSVGGLMGSLAALPGPATLLYWLASDTKAVNVRANMIYYLFITDLMIIVGYLVGEIYTLEAVIRGVMCMPGYFIGILIGSRFFIVASEATYRNVAFILILLAAVSSIPLLDGFLRG